MKTYPVVDHANIVVDTIEVRAYTELEKPVNSSNTTYMLLGMFKDPVFGVTETSFACKFSNSSYGSYEKGDICDSLILTMGVDTTANYFYGDSISDITVDVFRLTEPIVDTIDYYNNYDINGKYDATPIATTTFKPCEIDSMITFKVNKDFGDLVIKNTLDTTFDKNICGLYFRATQGNSIVKFYRSSNNTQYVLYHHVPAETETETVTSSSVIYCTRIRIDILGVEKINRGKYFSLRGAHLIAPLADSTVSAQKNYPAIDYVVCAGIDKASERDTVFNEFVLNMGGTASINILSRDVANNCYRLNMTGRVADLLDLAAKGEEPEYYIYLYPNARTTDFNRSVICSPVNKQTPMKLVVEYANYDM